MILMLINIMLLVLGTVMDMAPMILILTPILLPVVKMVGDRSGALRHDHDHEPRDRPDLAAGGHRALRRQRGREAADGRWSFAR